MWAYQSINQSINQSYSETRPPKEQSDCNSTGRDVHTHTVQNHTHILAMSEKTNL